MTEKANMPNVCDAITAEISLQVVLVVTHVQGRNHHDGDHHHLPQCHRTDRHQRRGLAKDLKNGARFSCVSLLQDQGAPQQLVSQGHAGPGEAQ